MTYTVYFLSSVNSDTPRYIGMTKNPSERLQDHLGNTRCRRTLLVADWVTRNAGNIKMTVIETSECWKRCFEREKQIISEMRATGIPLLNIHQGGELDTCTPQKSIAMLKSLLEIHAKFGTYEARDVENILKMIRRSEDAIKNIKKTSKRLKWYHKKNKQKAKAAAAKRKSG